MQKLAYVCDENGVAVNRIIVDDTQPYGVPERHTLEIPAATELDFDLSDNFKTKFRKADPAFQAVPE